MPPIRRSASTHALQRSIGRLAIGAAREMSRAEQRRAAVRYSEREEQFQIKCSGRASDYPTWQVAELIFDQTFSTATGNRMSLLTRPQIKFGYEVGSAVSEAPPVEFDDPGGVVTIGVILSAYLSQWLFDEAGDIRGARVNICAIAPGDFVRFQGFVHVTFQGFGALTEPAETGD